MTPILKSLKSQIGDKGRYDEPYKVIIENDVFDRMTYREFLPGLPLLFTVGITFMGGDLPFALRTHVEERINLTLLCNQ